MAGDAITIAEYNALKSKKAVADRRIKRIHTQFTDWLSCNGIAFVREYKFCKQRKWKNDYFLPDLNLAIEVEGGVWSGGRHVRGQGYLNDMEKYNALTMADIKLLRIDTDRLNSSYFKQLILELKNNSK